MSHSPTDILVVDDNKDSLELTTRVLRRAGFVVTSAKDLGEMDRELMTGSPPRLILMDVQMPELYGDDVASTLRHARGVTAKIYLYSSLDQDELASLARAASIDGWLSKSDGPTKLVEAVRTILASE